MYYIVKQKEKDGKSRKLEVWKERDEENRR